MKIYDNSLRLDILTTIAICGEYSYNSIDLIRGGHKWIVENIKQLIAEKYITSLRKGNERTLRLTKKAISLLAEKDKRLIQQYNIVTNHRQFSGLPNNIWRNHRISETMEMMHRIGTGIAFFEKPPLKQMTDERIYSEAWNISEWKQYFYTSREIRKANRLSGHKYDGTRFIGVYVTLGGIYSVYNINHGIYKLSLENESKIRGLIYELALFNGWLDSTHKTIGSEKTKAIVLCRENKSNEIGDIGCLNILQTVKQEENIGALHYVPMNEYGMRLLLILATPFHNENIINSFLPKEIREASHIYIRGSDGWLQKTNTYICFILDSDIKKLHNFKVSLQSFISQNVRAMVICYQWQQNIVRAIIPDAILKIVKMDDVEKILKLA